MRRSRITLVTSLGLALVVGVLALVGSVGLSRMRASSDAVQDAATRLAAYQGVQRALAGAAFAETDFHLTPGDGTRSELHAALAELDVAVDEVRRTGGEQDRVVAGRLLVLNHTHESELAARPQAATAPEVTAMQALLDEAVGRSAGELDAAFAHQRATVTRMLWRAPLVLVGAFLLLGLCWAGLVRYGHRATARAAVSEQLALEDPLTGLGNRRAFEIALDAELDAPSSDAVVLLLDLDGFKEINDTWGHDVGDEVLKSVAERLLATVRGTDVVARLGGDEFVVLARPVAHAEVLRARLAEAVAMPLHVRGGQLQPASSIGLAPVVPGQDQSEVLRAADRDLYVSKRERGPVSLLGERRAAR